VPIILIGGGVTGSRPATPSHLNPMEEKLPINPIDDYRKFVMNFLIRHLYIISKW